MEEEKTQAYTNQNLKHKELTRNLKTEIIHIIKPQNNQNPDRPINQKV